MHDGGSVKSYIKPKTYLRFNWREHTTIYHDTENSIFFFKVSHLPL